jgi:hypothetical protein
LLHHLTRRISGPQLSYTNANAAFPLHFLAMTQLRPCFANRVKGFVAISDTNLNFAQSCPHSACVFSMLSYCMKWNICWKTLHPFVSCFLRVAGVSRNFGHIISFCVSGNLSYLYIHLWILRSHFSLLNFCLLFQCCNTAL